MRTATVTPPDAMAAPIAPDNAMTATFVTDWEMPPAEEDLNTHLEGPDRAAA